MGHPSRTIGSGYEMKSAGFRLHRAECRSAGKEIYIQAPLYEIKMHGIYISMDTVALRSPQRAVVCGIIGQKVTYRAFRALFSSKLASAATDKLPRKGHFAGSSADLVRLVRLVRT
jgi:hypothetical protein